MVNPKLKNLIKKIILKEADDYLQDFSSFGDDEERKRRLRHYLASKNLSNVTVGPSSIKNFPEKGDEISLFSVNVRDLNPVQRAMLKQSLNNGNIQHKVESGVVSFSRKDAERIVYEIEKLLIEEYENAKESYKEYFFKYGDFDPIAGRRIENELTKRFEKKLFKELETTENFANDLARKIAFAIRDNYNDRSMDEAYVDASGLKDFDPFPYNVNVSDDKTPFYIRQIILKEPYQIEVMKKVLKIAFAKGLKKLEGYSTTSSSLTIKFNSKYEKLFEKILERIKKEEEIEFKKMQDKEGDMDDYEKAEQLKLFYNEFDKLVKLIKAK